MFKYIYFLQRLRNKEETATFQPHRTRIYLWCIYNLPPNFWA